MTQLSSLERQRVLRFMRRWRVEVISISTEAVNASPADYLRAVILLIDALYIQIDAERY